MNQFKKWFGCCAFFCVGFFSSSSNAGVLIIDDFASSQAAVQAPPDAIGTPQLSSSGFWSSRVLAIINAVGTPDLGAYIEVVRGQLQIANGPNVSATSAVTWELNQSALALALNNATFLSISIDQVSLDVEEVIVTGGGGRTSLHNGSAATLYSGTLAGLPNRFSASFQSMRSSDSTWDNLKVTFTCRIGATSITSGDQANDQCPSSVPVPGTLALLGLLPFAAFISSRRKVKNP
jgi:hypothetical protein